MLTGFCIVVPWAALVDVPDIDRSSAGWLLLAGLGNVLGLLLVYTALRFGKVGIVGPIVSTEGAIAALLAVLAGEHLAAGSAAMLVLIAVGIALAATTAEATEQVARVGRLGAVPVYALLAAFSFGTSIYATGRASAELPIAWAVAPPRVLGVLLVTLPLLMSRRLVLTRPAAPLVVVAGVAEVVGFSLFALGSRYGLALAAVLASQFAAVAAVAAYFLFRERLSRLQVAGVTTIVAGVTVLTALQAS
jgi:drug/metabolite transporter (DMT)-like permease